MPQIEENFNNININEFYNFNNQPKEFFCVICKKNIEEKDRVDHLLCHNLENEQENEINNNGNIGNNGNNGNNDLYGFSQKDSELQRKIEKQIERNKKKNQQNQNIRRNDFDNRNNNILNNINNNNNNFIRPNINNRRPNINYNNNNNGSNINNHRNNQNNINNNINNNQPNRGPAITIRQTGQNGNSITARFYQNKDIDFSAGPRMNFISNRNRTNNNNNNHRRRDINVFNEFGNAFEELLNKQNQGIDRQLFNEFPEPKIDDVNKLDNEKRNCVICSEDFKSGEKAKLLPCLHLFHKNCIKEWLEIKNVCPLCKFKLTRENINRQNSKF
jgi:hypothetical protein